MGKSLNKIEIYIYTNFEHCCLFISKFCSYNVEVSDRVHKFLVENLKFVAALVGHVIFQSSRYNQLLDVKQGTWIFRGG